MCLTGDADRKIVGDGVIGLQVGGHRYDVNETKKIAANTSSSLIQIETTISAQATSFTDEAKKNPISKPVFIFMLRKFSGSIS